MSLIQLTFRIYKSSQLVAPFVPSTNFYSRVKKEEIILGGGQALCLGHFSICVRSTACSNTLSHTHTHTHFLSHPHTLTHTYTHTSERTGITVKWFWMDLCSRSLDFWPHKFESRLSLTNVGRSAWDCPVQFIDKFEQTMNKLNKSKLNKN